MTSKDKDELIEKYMSAEHYIENFELIKDRFKGLFVNDNLFSLIHRIAIAKKMIESDEEDILKTISKNNTLSKEEYHRAYNFFTQIYDKTVTSISESKIETFTSIEQLEKLKNANKPT